MRMNSGADEMGRRNEGGVRSSPIFFTANDRRIFGSEVGMEYRRYTRSPWVMKRGPGEPMSFGMLGKRGARVEKTD